MANNSLYKSRKKKHFPLALTVVEIFTFPIKLLIQPVGCHMIIKIIIIIIIIINNNNNNNNIIIIIIRDHTNVIQCNHIQHSQ